MNSIDLEKDIFPYDNDFFDVIIANPKVNNLEHLKTIIQNDSENLTFRQAAFVIGVERVVKATKLRGYV